MSSSQPQREEKSQKKNFFLLLQLLLFYFLNIYLNTILARARAVEMLNRAFALHMIIQGFFLNQQQPVWFPEPYQN